MELMEDNYVEYLLETTPTMTMCQTMYQSGMMSKMGIGCWTNGDVIDEYLSIVRNTLSMR